jgi:hypothetical protein
MNHQRPGKPREQEKVRKETLLRAEYVLPPREPDRPRAKRGADSEAGQEQHWSPRDSLDAATTEATIAQAQLLTRVRSLTHQGQVGIRTVVGKWAPLALGLAVTFTIGLTLLPLAFMGRRRRRGWMPAGTNQSWAAPVTMELLKAAGVGLTYWRERTSDENPVRAPRRRVDVVK